MRIFQLIRIFSWQAFAPRQLLLHCSNKLHPCNDAKPAYMPSMAINTRQHRAENWSVYKIREDWPGRRFGTEFMYRMYCMSISPKAPTFGAGAKIGNAAIAEKDN